MIILFVGLIAVVACIAAVIVVVRVGQTLTPLQRVVLYLLVVVVALYSAPKVIESVTAGYRVGERLRQESPPSPER